MECTKKEAICKIKKRKSSDIYCYCRKRSFSNLFPDHLGLLPVAAFKTGDRIIETPQNNKREKEKRGIKSCIKMQAVARLSGDYI